MTKLFRLTPVLLLALALFGAGAAMAGKQAICHFPPGNPANFHTITVSDNAVDKHVAKHDDLIGSCLANCETICDDGDFCTQDVASDPDQCVCLAEPRPAVDCNDSNDCTADSCDSDIGACLNNAEILDGDACDDGDPGTTGEICTDGECTPPPTVTCPCNDPEVNLFWTQIIDGSTQEEYPIDDCVDLAEQGIIGLQLWSGDIPLVIAGVYGTPPDLFGACGNEGNFSTATAPEAEVCIQELEVAAALAGVDCYGI